MLNLQERQYMVQELSAESLGGLNPSSCAAGMYLQHLHSKALLSQHTFHAEWPALLK